MARKRVSIAQHNEKYHKVKKLIAKLNLARAEFAKMDECEVLANCPLCKGEGKLGDEKASIDCPDCEGTGYFDVDRVVSLI